MPLTNSRMLRQYLYQNLVDFQKKIADLSFDINRFQDEQLKREKELYLELFEILDSFENVFDSLEGKGSVWEKSAQLAMKSFRSIYKKISRVLTSRGIEPIEFPEQKAIFGLCKVVETKSVPEMENEHIVAILRKGYRKKTGEVLRPAEVITVLNK